MPNGRSAKKQDHGCDDMISLLARFLDDDLEKPDRLAVERHLADCDRCRWVLARAFEVSSHRGKVRRRARPATRPRR